MQAAKELTNILQGVLQFNKARINFIAQFIIALIKVRTVNWVEISQAFSGKTKIASKYRRIQRFFQQCAFCKETIACLVASFFPVPKEGWDLSMDRTNWNFGIFKINILMLSITLNNIAIPLIWIMLPKKGNSNTAERIKLMELFLKIFSNSSVSSLLCDREFVGDDWLEWLYKNNINFTIRVRNNFKVINHKGKIVKVSKLFYKSSTYGRTLKNPVFIGKIKVFIAGAMLETGEWLIVITNHSPETTLDRYKVRWGIESLFAALKTRGFNLEQTHISSMEKVSALIAMLTIAYIWSYKLGEVTSKTIPIKTKSHGRKQQSIFRAGLDLLRSALLNLQDYYSEAKFYLKIFRENIRKILTFKPIEAI